MTNITLLYTFLLNEGNQPSPRAPGRARLADEQFKKLSELQADIRKGRREKADRDLADFQTKDQILKGTLALYGIDDKDKRYPALVGQLGRMLDRRLRAMQDQGVKVTNTEIQNALEHLLAAAHEPAVPGRARALLPGGAPWWVAFVPTGQRGFFDRPERTFQDITVDDISPDDARPWRRSCARRAGP